MGERCAVVGATGYTGNLVVGELVRRGVEVVAVGRNPAKRIPPAVAWAACYGAEALARARRATEAPRLSRGRMRFLYYNQHYSGEKARRELGYRPQVTFREGVRPTLAWYREHGLLPASPAVV